MNKRIVSLFSGAGGLDMGFFNQGFDIVWANEIDSDACKTHKAWSSGIIVNENIKNIDFSTIPDCDLILGGFPCQGFSLAGPRKIDDSRNSLYKYFVSLVENKKPLIFVAENVKGLLSMGEGEIFEAIIEDFSSKGYNVKHFLVNASDYEVPQDRERVIIIGFRKDLNYEEYTFPNKIERKKTIKDALENLDEAKDDEICKASYSSRYMSRNRKRDFNEQSFTIPAMAKQVPLYPGSPSMIKVDKDKWEFGKGDTRRFSYKECAAIQTFPKDMIFFGNLDSKYRQIGNAVPVKLSEHIAKSILDFLEGDENL